MGRNVGSQFVNDDPARAQYADGIGIFGQRKKHVLQGDLTMALHKGKPVRAMERLVHRSGFTYRPDITGQAVHHPRATTSRPLTVRTTLIRPVRF